MFSKIIILKVSKDRFNRLQKECDSKTNGEVLRTLKMWFTDAQISLLLGKRKRVTWAEQKRSYIYLRNILHYPLPGSQKSDKTAFS